MKAVLSTRDSRKIEDFDVPEPQAGEVLIKNVAVSSNPKDWKIPHYMGCEHKIEGNDVAGYVEQVGEGVKDFARGDRVYAFTKMRTDVRFGAYAEYSVAPACTTAKLGPKTKFEDAAALPLAYLTAAVGLYRRLELPEKAPTDASAILVYGAATTVGCYAIQLAKRGGYYVVGIAGQGGDYAKSIGCDEIIDYRHKSQEELSEAIAAVGSKRKLNYVYDAVSEKGSLEAIAAALAKQPEGGVVTYVLTYSDEQLKALPKNVKAVRTLVATAYGEDSDLCSRMMRDGATWLEQGSFKAHHPTIIPGGLAGVDEGLKRLQEGTVHATKLVYRIAETPGL